MKEKKVSFSALSIQDINDHTGKVAEEWRAQPIKLMQKLGPMQSSKE